MRAFRTLDDLPADLGGAGVLVRVDFNVPMKNGSIADDTRLRAAVPTIRDLRARNAAVILLSHFGRPKGKVVPDMSLRPMVQPLSALLGVAVGFCDDLARPALAAKAVAPRGVLLLENLRFVPGEEANDPQFARTLADCGDLWVNDAFSAAHRAHASTEGLGRILPAYAGRSMQAELEALGKALETPQRPLAAIVGGAKVSTKLDLLGNLIAKVDVLIIGGGMANTFLAAQGFSIGKSLAENELADTARAILAKAKAKGCEIVLPVDAVAATAFKANAPSRTVAVDCVAEDEMILDIGRKSIEHAVSVLGRVKTLVWNGPFGAFELEPFDTGTVEVAEAAAELTAAGKLVSVAGGGDTVAALNAAGVVERFSYISTAGGAFLEWMEGKPLPGVAILNVE
ncbi:MAG: phosphoglycerate kinase [Hyphomicrobiales bacterium]|nr:phosphoglycerate kinase [Hyphomicrobiales bacterium]